VIWSIGAELLEANTDLLEPYTPKEAAMIADAFKTSGAWLAVHLHLNVFVAQYEEAQARGIPEALDRPRASRGQGPVSMAMPRIGLATCELNTFLTIYQRPAARAGDKFKEVFKEHSVNPSSGAVPRFVNDGRAVVGITLEDNRVPVTEGRRPGRRSSIRRTAPR
jgi:iron(III) transport system substrate-binding protein